MRKCAKRTLCDLFISPLPLSMVVCLSVVGTLAGAVAAVGMTEFSAVVGCESFGKKHNKGNRLDQRRVGNISEDAQMHKTHIVGHFFATPSPSPKRPRCLRLGRQRRACCPDGDHEGEIMSL